MKKAVLLPIKFAKMLGKTPLEMIKRAYKGL